MIAGLEPVLVVVFFAAAIVNGIAGLGLALLAAAFVAVAVDPRLAVLLLGIVSPVASSQQMYLHRAYASVIRRVMPLLVGGLAGVVLGGFLLAYLPIAALSLLFGAFTLWYVAASTRRRETVKATGLHAGRSTIVGMIAGVTAGALGASGPVLGTYLAHGGLRPREFVFALGSAFFVMSTFRFAWSMLLGLYDAPTLILSALLVIPALGGQAVGFRLHRRLDAESFRRVVLLVLFVAGVLLLVRGGSGLLA